MLVRGSSVGRWISRTLRVALVVTVAAAAFAPAAAGAFTLIQGSAVVFVNPSSGYPTTAFKVLGTFTYPGGCPPGPYTFHFLFDSTEVWTVNVTVCDPNTYVWTTGWSPGIKPPGSPAPG